MFFWQSALPIIRKKYSESGFTLIELSIVLVIIGLIVGGVLVGRDLIRASEVRATITQVEKFNTAANTFYNKYLALPGDLNSQVANQFGFALRGLYAGEGDGNQKLEGNTVNTSTSNYGFIEGGGETAMFWVDLTTANGLNLNLIDGSFSAAVSTANPSSTVTGAAISNWLPAAKMGAGNYFYVHSASAGCMGWSNFGGNNNLIGISAVTSISTGGHMYSTPGLTVKQAYDIDQKVDDGIPNLGRVQAIYIDTNTYPGCGSGFAPNAAANSSTTCLSLPNGSSSPGVYSISQNNGAGVNCAISFKLQAGD